MENRNFKTYTVQDLVNKKRKRCDKNINKSKRSPAGVEQAKEKKWKFFEIIDRTLCDISPSVFFSHFAKMSISFLA